MSDQTEGANSIEIRDRRPRFVHQRSTTTLVVFSVALALIGGSFDRGVAAAWDEPATLAATPVDAGCAPTGQTVHRDIPYAVTDGDPALTTLDIYELTRPGGCAPSPILAWVHGGGWRIGDKRNRIDDKARLAEEQGWTLIAVNYRLTPEVMYPVPNQDVADAVAWSLDHAADYGADPFRTAVMGHSAGGGIVAAIATDERYLQNAGTDLSALDCVISLDTEGYDITARGGDGGVYDAMFGTDPTLWPDASPVFHVEAGKSIPDFFIVTRGGPTRVALAQHFTDTLRAADVPTTLIDVPLSHSGVNAAVGDPADTLVTPPLVAFLEGCFA